MHALYVTVTVRACVSVKKKYVCTSVSINPPVCV